MNRKQFVDSSIVQPNLWDALDLAEDVPEDADLAGIWTSLDLALEALSVRAQLTLAGDAIARIAQLIQDRAWLTIEELQQLGNTEGSILSIGVLDRFVRQSMQVRFERFVEAPPVPPRLSQEGNQAELPDDGRSVVVELDPAALLNALDAELEFVELQTVEQAIALAYSENVQEWNEAIVQYFMSQPLQSLSFSELTTAIQAVGEKESKERRSSAVHIWLALLLCEYTLEQRGEFYQSETLWITRNKSAE